MASKPGILTHWPWQHLGSFKYLILAPWVIRYTHSYCMAKQEEDRGGMRDLAKFLIFPLLLSRMIHNQIWISISRYRTAKGNNLIVDKTIEFDQVDRERNWDDQILFNGILFYIASMLIKQVDNLPLWRTDGVIFTILLHAGPVEFLYYWLHRALHHHFLYSRYHSHHHSSIVTEPISSVIHPFAEHIAYFVLFAIPMLSLLVGGMSSIAALAGYVTYVDFMNNMGHCNFELVPRWLFSIFPPLKYLMYTPSYHSLHHTQFRTNYSLFMPIYDYIYGTMDQSTDTLYENSTERPEESADVVHLTHLTTPESIYHLRLGFAYLASRPHSSKWYLWLMWPVTLWSMLVCWIYGRTFVLERNVFNNLKLQTWAIPKYKIQYLMQWQRESINSLIEEAIIDADKRGTKVLSLGLLNQGEELNRNGEVYIRRHPELKVKVVDGSSLAAAVVLNSIPKGTIQVILRGRISTVAVSIVLALFQRHIQVNVLHEDEYTRLKSRLETQGSDATNLVLSKAYAQKTQTSWLVGDDIEEEEQTKAPKGTIFIPFTQFPPKKMRRDCRYLSTPAMVSPKHLENVDSCENWLPRRVMSAWRIAGIVHALEGWDGHECGNNDNLGSSNLDKGWDAALKHGFRPLNTNACCLLN